MDHEIYNDSTPYIGQPNLLCPACRQGEQHTLLSHLKLISRLLTNEELADLPSNWENPTVDTTKYFQVVFRAWEVDEITYLWYKRWGGLCQSNNGRYYIA